MKMLGMVAGSMLAFAIPAHAEIATNTEKVPYKKSELASETGIQALKDRVQKAAARVCKPDGGGTRIYSIDCYRTAVRDGMKQVNRAAHQYAMARQAREVLLASR